MEVKIMSILCMGLILSMSSQTMAGSTEKSVWKAGTAKAVITPEKPMWMAGYGGRNHPSEGTIHDLWIKVLALEDADGNRAVVLSSDLLGFPKGMYDNICAELKKKLGLDRSQIRLTCSHTHSGPVLDDALYDIYPLDEEQTALIVEYSAGLEKKVIAAVVEAFSDMRPVTLSGGEGVCTFAVNRRNNSEAQVLEKRERGEAPVGPSDHSVPVLAVRTTDDELMAVVFGYACHNTTLSLYQWSGDYAGFAQIAFESKHPDTLAMFYIGCGSDQNPIPRRTVEHAEEYGNMLATSVDEVLAKDMRPISPKLRTAFEFVTLDFDKPVTKAELEVLATKGSYIARWADRLLKRLDNGEAFETNYPYPVQVWRLGDDQLWFALGGEIVVDYSLILKSKYGPETWVAGYSNDVMSYIPSTRVREEGGYESGAFTVYGLPTQRWCSDIEERIVGSVGRLVEKVRK